MALFKISQIKFVGTSQKISLIGETIHILARHRGADPFEDKKKSSDAMALRSYQQVVELKGDPEDVRSGCVRIESGIEATPQEPAEPDRKFHE